MIDKPQKFKIRPWYIRLWHWIIGRKYYISVDYGTRNGENMAYVLVYRDSDGTIHIVNTIHTDADGNEVRP